MPENKDVVENTSLAKEDSSKEFNKQVKKYKRLKARPFNLFCVMSGFILLFGALILAHCFSDLSTYLYAVVSDQKFYFPANEDIVFVFILVMAISTIVPLLSAIIVSVRKSKQLKPADYKEPPKDEESKKKHRSLNTIKFFAGLLIPVFLSGIATCLIISNAYQRAIEDYENLNYEKSNATFMALCGYKDSKERIVDISKEIAFCNDYIARIDRKTKKVNIEWTEENTEYTLDVSNWKNVVAIDGGYDVVVVLNESKIDYRAYIVGLTEDGKVLFSGNNQAIKKAVAKWDDIVDICAEDDFLIGLKKDGTVVAAGENKYGQCNVSGWKDIAKIESYLTCSMGITITIRGRFYD